MSLTTCLKKAGSAIRAEDKAAILAGARTYRGDGLSPDDAAKKAIADQLEVIGKAVAKEQARLTVKPQPLYAQRTVTNAADIIAWAQSQGFKTTLPAGDLHVTQAYSTTPMRGTDAGKAVANVSIDGGTRSVEPLGDGGAIVLKFSSDAMQARWKQYRDAGASWDYDGYTPHITLTYDAGSLDLSKVTPYAGKIELGPEKQEVLNPDHKENITEAPVLTSPTQADVLAQQQRKADGDKAEAKAAKAIEQKAKADAEVGEFTLTGSDRAADVGAAAGQSGLFANEPTVGYDGTYESDLFGNPLPASQRSNRPARSAAAGLRGDAQPTGALRDTPAPRADYFVNTVIGSEVSRDLGASVVNTAAQAAQATRYLYKSAVERLDGIVTDKDGKPLAVIGGFKGAVSQTAVYPATLMAEAVRIPGAAQVWFSHNHPSGTARLSNADEQLNFVLTGVFKGSGIEPMGLLAIAGDQFSHVDPYGSVSQAQSIPTTSTKTSVPVIERELRDGAAKQVIDSPQAGTAAGKAYYAKAKKPGLMLLDSQLGIVGWLPATPAMMGALRGTGGLNAIYRALSQSNAGAAIIVHGGELDARVPGEPVTLSQNIAAALQKVDVRALDSINAKTGKSVAESGVRIADGPVYSLADAKMAYTPPDGLDAAPTRQQALADQLADRLNANLNAGRVPTVLHAVTPRAGDASDRARSLAATAITAKRLFGHEVVFVDFGGAPLFNGAMSRAIPGVVFIRVDSAKPHMAILGHELLHQMRASNPGLYNQLDAALTPLLTEQGASQFLDKLTAAYKSHGLQVPNNWDEELWADVAGDNFMDPEFLKALGAEQPALFQRVVAAISKFLDTVVAKLSVVARPFGTDQYMRDVKAARAAVADAFRQFSGTKDFSSPARALPSNARSDATEKLSIANQPENKLNARAAFKGTKYDTGNASPGKAKADAEDVLGFKSTVPTLIENRPDMPDVPMRYDLQQGVILYNKAVKRTAAEDVEYMVEEILHAIDHVGGSKTISASSTRLQKGGDLRIELEAAYKKSAAIKEKLGHPLDEIELHDSVVRAELYARSAMLYHSNPQMLRVTAPQTYEAHRATFTRQADQNQVPGNVRGLPNPGFETGQSRLGGDTVSDAAGAGDSDQNAAGLAGLRRRIADRFGGRVDGEEVDFNGNGASLNARQPGLFSPNIWSAPPDTKTDRLIYNVQNTRVDLNRVQDAITESGQKIAEQWDARLAETLYPGRVAHRTQSFLEGEPKSLFRAMKANNVGMDELADYLHARGAEERNVQIAKVNPGMPDGGAGTNTKGTLMTTQAAKDYLAGVSPTRTMVLAAMAKRVDAITAGTRNLLVAEGLEKQETIDAWTAAYKNYVPMFRDEAAESFPSHPQGAGFTVKGSASKRAMGSTKEVTNILAHVLMQREVAITRAEKNRVALALYGQALSHPNPDFWTTIQPSMQAEAIGKQLTAMGVDPLTAEVGMAGVPTVQTIDPNTGKVVNRPNPMYKTLPGAITLKVNGDDRVLMLNVKHPRGERLAASLKNMDGLTDLDLASGLLSKFWPHLFSPKIGVAGATRWMASVNTQYNPAFGLVNLTRDVLGGAINLGSTELRGNALKVLFNTPAAIFGVARELASSGSTGKWSKLYADFVADGGQTGFKENFRDPGDRARAIEKEIKALGRSKLNPVQYAHYALDLLDGFNTTLENAVRVSTYKAGLDKGLSRAEAARLGRELTVDFNRKGRLGREAGPLYAFFNASVQGSARTIATLKGPTGKRVIMGGLGLGIMQAVMLAAAGYDDDEIPEFVKTRALIIPMLGGDEKTYISIPYPLGLHVIPNTGRVMAELALNGGKDIGKRSVTAVGEIAAAFNPLGGSDLTTKDGWLKMAAPTVVDPIIEMVTNKNFAGTEIEKRGFGDETDNRPGVNRARESTQRSTTGQVYMGISKAMNAATGGSDYEAGAVSPTPEMVRYVSQTIGGGVLREIEKSVNASTASSRGDKVKSSQIPVMGRFYGEVDDEQVQRGRYFKSDREMKALTSVSREIKKHGTDADLDAFEKKHPEIELERDFQRTRARIAKLNRFAVETINDPKELASIDADRAEEMREINAEIKSLEKASGKVTPAEKLREVVKEKVPSWR